jgi:hypothetical protein
MTAMDTQTAADYVNNDLVYPPGIVITADDYSHRYLDTIRVEVLLPKAKNSNRDNAPSYRKTVRSRQAFTLYVGDKDKLGVAKGVIDLIVTVMSHDIREFVRYRDTLDAPFHPHQDVSIRRWAELNHTDPAHDYYYGLA